MIHDGSYAVIYTPENKIGRLVDISRSGLALTYFSTSDGGLSASKIDILTDQVSLKGFPCSSVSDIPMGKDQPYSQITMRRHSIMFGKLDHNQQRDLDLFVARFQHHELPDQRRQES